VRSLTLETGTSIRASSRRLLPLDQMATFISHSVEETESLGETWGREAPRGLVIALMGDLGAGKTQLVRGLARGLGCAARVHSPTFTLVNVYEGGRLPLFHLDLYRLETLEQIHGAGVDEYLQPEGVAVIEWSERIIERGTRSAERGMIRQVTIEVVDDTTRRITYEDSGA
jgi:tRNA threonylcarbamoyladenosine biosynthesis protein TsaE